jgi:hypothetical protein
MSTVALLLAVSLAGQVRAANERYPAGGGAPTGGNAAPAAGTAASGSPSGTGLIPRISPPPDDGQARSTTPGGGTGGASNPANPYAPPAGAPAAGGVVSPPPAFSGQPSFRNTQPQTGAEANSAAVTPGAKPKPSAIMKQMLSPPAGSQLTGTSASLIEVVSGARSRAEQAYRVEAYWDLCSSVADYYLGVLEQSEMRNLRSLNANAGAAMQQAEAKFAVRLGTSKQAAVASQRRLASMMGRDGSLPLPTDLPHCGSYQSHYEEIFASRPSIEAQELASLLPLRYAELKDFAATVVRTRADLDAIARNDSGGTDTLQALELLALQRRAFVQIARDYNRRIARYAELSTPGEIGAERLVGMLIKLDNTPTATRPTLPTSTNGRQSRDARGTPPQTFADAEGWEPAGQSVSRATTRDESVQQAAAKERQAPREERSLLVTPR